MNQPDPKVVKQILLLQNALHAAPNSAHLGVQTCYTLLSVPGLVGAGLIVNGKVVAMDSSFENPLGVNWVDPGADRSALGQSERAFKVESIPLKVSLQTHDQLVLAIYDREACLPYFPYLQSTANLIALILETQQQEADLKTAMKASDSSNRDKSAFLANMSHELRTPMNAILGYTQLLQCDTLLSDTQTEYVAVIDRSGQNLLGLINEIMEMSKIEAGYVDIFTTTFDFHDFLKELETTFRIRAEAKGIKLDVESWEDVAHFLNTDEFKLRQILINILGNALKFTERGGIYLRVQSQARADGSVRVIVEVEDTGYGISAVELGKVFDPFEQTASGRRNGSGTGLGMSLSRQYARLLNGDISVKSELDHGSVFHLEFDARVGSETEVEKPHVTEHSVLRIAPGERALRILVVDGCAINRQPLIILLSGVGFETREAVDGLEAMEAFKKWHPDVIFMDLQKPNLDGYETVRRMKATSEGARTPIFIVSVSALDEDRTLALKAGADGFIRKPYVEKTIFEAIHQATGVKYLYGKLKKNYKDDPKIIIQLSPESLQVLPLELRAAMGEVLAQGDNGQLAELINRASEFSPEVAQGLRQLARRYDYDLLSKMLGEEEEENV